MQLLGAQGTVGVEQPPEIFQSAPEKPPPPAPWQVGGIVVAARHGKTDPSCSVRFRHEDANPRIRPRADGSIERQGSQHTALVAGRHERWPQAGRLSVFPGCFPLMNYRGVGKQPVNFATGRAAEDMDFVTGCRPADKREAHHRISEVMKFNHKEAGLHRANQRRLSR